MVRIKNHFFYAYAGNKRNECNDIFNYIKNDIEKYNNIIEPFCGSCAFSVFMSKLYPLKFKYILNDLDTRLIELLNLSRDKVALEEFLIILNNNVIGLNKIKYKEIIKTDTLLGYVMKRLIYTITPGLFPLDYKEKVYTFDNLDIVKFMRTENITLSSVDGLDIVNQYKYVENTFIFLDPPYLLSNNEFYKMKKGVNIYEYLTINGMNDFKSWLLLVIERNWITGYIFKDYIKEEWNKNYEMSKKKTTHIIVSNK
jgi:site-specific DNA-adenine methylase